jgi:hypothetical protein
MAETYRYAVELSQRTEIIDDYQSLARAVLPP